MGCLPQKSGNIYGTEFYTDPKTGNIYTNKQYDFEKNQVGKDNRVIRRPVCKECRSVKVKINPKQKKEYDINSI
jgi:hypothetical protein